MTLQSRLAALVTAIGADIKALQVPRVAALPSSPVNGQEICFVADAANGIIWRLRYNAGSASAYKWECIGGSFLSSNVAGASNTLGGGGSYSTQLVDGTGIVNLQLPLSGDYWVDSTCVASAPDGSVRNCSAGVMRSGDASPAVAGFCGTSAGGGWANLSAFGRLNNCLAGPTGKLFMAYQYTAVVVAYSSRQFHVRPIRVG